jgi:class 3 adenylate cyclase/tetratricopeptide (TPR) repeat protein
MAAAPALSSFVLGLGSLSLEPVLNCANCGRENPDEARFCMACASPLGAGTPLREVRKTVTVLFCDVTRSTALGESTDPEALRALLARYFERMKAIVERHGGTVEKFIGDAVMAVFGVPVVHEDDALRACRAAVEMRDALPGLGISGRIGVNTGEVVTGTEERLATGDAVNVAARLEQAAQPGEVLIGEPTYALVKSVIEVEAIEPLELKGKAEPVPAYRLLAAEGEFVRRFASPMVGREAELTRLRSAFAQAVHDRSCQLFTVLGSAGVGKSRLAREFLAGVDASVVTGRCLAYGEGITYWPVVEVLKQLGSLPEGDAARPLRSLLGETDAPASADEIAWGFRKLLDQEAQARPLVCVFDDLHWGEETLLDLVEHVADLSRDAPILLLCMARPELLERRPSWGGGKWNATTVLLEPLDGAETLELIGKLGDVPAELRTRIVQVAEGNPLFLEETLALVRDSPDERVEVPPTIQALLASRLDQLNASEREVLQCGSVEGRVFHTGAVAELSTDPQPVSARLTALVRKDLVRPDRPQLEGEDAFRFRHLLIRDAAYDALPKATRAELHQRFAAWLGIHGTSLVEFDEIIAYHLEQAYRYRQELGLADRSEEIADAAAKRLAAAGRRAFDRGDMAAAAKLLERAAALLESQPQRRVCLLPTLGRALTERGDWDGAERVLTEAVETGEALGERGAAAGAVDALWFLRLHVYPETTHDQIRGELRKAIPVLEELKDGAGLARAFALEGSLQFWRGQTEAALVEFDRALALARQAGDRATEMATLRASLAAAFYGSEPVEAVLGRIDTLTEHSTGTSSLAVGMFRFRGELEAMRGDPVKAREAIAEAKSIRDELGLEGVEGVEASAAGVEMLGGDPVAAEHELRIALASMERRNDWGHLVTVVPYLVDTLLMQGRGLEAASIIDQAFELAIPDDADANIGLRRVKARVLAERGELEEAERLAREAVARSERIDYLNLRGLAYGDLAEVFVLAGRRVDVSEALERALACYERKGNLAMTQRVRGRLDLARAAE